MLALALEHGGNPNVYAADGSFILLSVIATSRIGTANILLNGGASVELGSGEGNMLPLHVAAMWGNKKIIQMLLDKDADVTAIDEHGWTALMYADFHYAGDVKQMLSDAGAALPEDAYWKGIYAINHHLDIDLEELAVLAKDADAFVKSKMKIFFYRQYWA